MKEQNINMSREELEKIWCKNNANVPRMESEYPATPEEAIMLNGKDVMKALKQYEVPTGSIKIWDLPEGYQFTDENGNVINATKIVLEKKSPKIDDIIKWLREHDMTKYIGVIYSGMCSITFDTEKLTKDITEMMGDE